MKLRHIIGVGAVIAAVAASVAYAAIPAGNGTISACVNKNTGELKLIDAEAGETCTGNKKLVTWNQAGLPGPAGPQGAPGPQGTPGPNLDEVGYANVGSNGSNDGSSIPNRTVEEVTRTSAGHYEIRFNDNMSMCERWISTTAGPRMFSVGALPNPAVLRVVAYSPTGVANDASFTVNISC